MEGHRSYFCGCAAKPNPKGPKWKASGPTCKWKASGPTFAAVPRNQTLRELNDRPAVLPV